MDECEELVLKTAVPRFIYKKFDFTVNEDGVTFKNTSMVLPVSLLRSTCINVIVQYAWL